MNAEMLDTDVLIIGGGAAGCSAALKAHSLGSSVLMVVKGKMGRSGATPLASGIGSPPPVRGPHSLIALLKKLYSTASNVVSLPVPEPYKTAIRRMVGAHYGLVDQDYFLNFGIWAIREFFPALESTGLYIVRDESGSPALPLGKNPSTAPYILHSHGMTGYQFGESKRKEVLTTDTVVLEEAMAFSLLQGGAGEVIGAMVFDYKHGRLYAVRAKATILATGHTNWLAKRSTGTREMAANGLAMAARAGAELQNLEIQWFHASDTASPDSWMRLHHYPNPLTATEHRAVMRNRDGEMYMKIEEYDVSMPYTIQMKKLYEQVRTGRADWDNGSFADFSLIDGRVLKKYQYHWEFYEKLGKNMSKDLLEAGITWHMTGGGVRANVQTLETALQRLFIAGAVGGHMLGSLLFATYDGEVAGAQAVRCAQALGPPSTNPEQVRGEEHRLAQLLSTAQAAYSPGFSPIEIKTRIREIVWNNMMYVKTEEKLLRALKELSSVRETMLPNMRLRASHKFFNTELVDALDIEDMLDVCEMSAHASLVRKESRGPHFREDFPFTDNANWLKQVVITRSGGHIKSRLEPVKQKYLKPSAMKIDYLKDPYA